MYVLLLMPAFMTGAVQPGSTGTPIMVQEYEKASSLPQVWVVNIPNDHASVALTREHAQDSGQCLRLQYKFKGTGEFQYLGIANKTKILAPVHQLRYMLYGDNSKCSYGVQLTDIRGETHQYSKNTGQCGLIDFAGWREVVVNLDSGHETWGGDNNKKLDYPITAITLTIGQPAAGGKLVAVEGRLDFDSLSVSSERAWRRRSAVRSPCFLPGIAGDPGKHPSRGHGARYEERHREMLEARQPLRFRFHHRHRAARRAREW